MSTAARVADLRDGAARAAARAGAVALSEAAGRALADLSESVDGSAICGRGQRDWRIERADGGVTLLMGSRVIIELAACVCVTITFQARAPARATITDLGRLVAMRYELPADTGWRPCLR